MIPAAARWAGLLAGPVFVVSFVIQGALRPGYDPLRHPVSSLSLGPGGWIQMLTFWVTGLLVIGFAIGLRRAGIGRATPILIAIVGLGIFAAGFFACDPISGYPPGSPIPAPRTLHGIVHDMVSTPVFTVLPAAMIVLARRWVRAGRRGWAVASALAAPALFGCFVMAAVGFAQNPAVMPYAGLWQRLSLIIGFGWLTLLSVAPLPAAGAGPSGGGRQGE